jgi:hypothetical protein
LVESKGLRLPLAPDRSGAEKFHAVAMTAPPTPAMKADEAAEQAPAEKPLVTANEQVVENR